MFLDNATILQRLVPPAADATVDVVLDTDTFNEIDDQFALAYLLRSTSRLNLLAVYAAPFMNHHAPDPAVGMQRSYEELFHCYELLGEQRYEAVTFKGSTRFLTGTEAGTLEESAAVQDLIRRARQHSAQRPLYVIGIACATNIATAILLAPDIIERIVVLWLGGLSYDWYDNDSFNAGQDVIAANVLLDCGVPLVQFPGRNVLTAFATTGPELQYWLAGKNKFCDYLVAKATDEAAITGGNQVWSRTLWDVVPVAWLVDQSFLLDTVVKSPIMQPNHYYSFDPRRHLIKYVYRVERDPLMQDLFTKLAQISK